MILILFDFEEKSDFDLNLQNCHSTFIRVHRYAQCDRWPIVSIVRVSVGHKQELWKTAEVSRVETEADPAYRVGRGQFDRGSPAPKGPKSEAQMADTVRMGSWRGAVSPSPLAPRVGSGAV